MHVLFRRQVNSSNLLSFTDIAIADRKKINLSTTSTKFPTKSETHK